MGEYAKTFVAGLPQSPGAAAYVVGLRGELGAGKTTFVQAVAKELGVVEDLTSPTYVIAQSYLIPHNSVFKKLVHIDAYRLTPEEPDTIGFGAALKDPANLVMVEWPENLPATAGLPADAPVICFAAGDEHTRHVILSEPASVDHRTR